LWLRTAISDCEERTQLEVFENRLVREVFGIVKDEVNKKFKIFHNEELTDFYRSHCTFRTGNLESSLVLAMWLVAGGDIEWVQNFGGECSCKTSTWKTGSGSFPVAVSFLSSVLNRRVQV
jgi:hypothetical protein